MQLNHLTDVPPRVIGTYIGRQPGPLVIAIGAVHGNEPAGFRAIQEVLRLLDIEPEHNPAFQFSGAFVGLTGNRKALHEGRRYIDRDLNRLWSLDYFDAINRGDASAICAEAAELLELRSAIEGFIEQFKPNLLVLLDLHTTSAEGGIFCLPAQNAFSLQMAQQLNVPVIDGMLDGMTSTLLHYVTDGHFQPSDRPQQTACMAFESGQHTDPRSASCAVAAIVHGLRAFGCLRPEDVDSRHEQILQEMAHGLPLLTRLRYVHRIPAGKTFRMKPGYANFQPIQRGEHLADESEQPIFAPSDGLILMPLYQPLGSDGFFIIQ